MFGLAVLFGFFIWLLLTFFVMWIGKRIAMRLGKSKNVGRFWGFMLAMGWLYCIFAYQFVETVVVAQHYCQQAGVWTYITPEEWRAIPREADAEKKPPSTIVFKGIEYEYLYPVNETGVFVYSAETWLAHYVVIHDTIYYDLSIEKAIYHTKSVESAVRNDFYLFDANLSILKLVDFFEVFEKHLPQCEYKELRSSMRESYGF